MSTRCEHKKRFRSPGAADRAAKRYPHGRRQRAYRCPVCRQWHLTTTQNLTTKKPKPPPKRVGIRSRHRASTREELEQLAAMLRTKHTTEDT